METTPKISIVTPSFNQAAFIEEALWSVKRQDYPNVEHIVMDGASTDGTVEILRRYSAQPGWEHLHWVSEPDRGQTHAINKGFAGATGDILAYLCSDDVYAPGAFSFVSDFLTRNPDIDLLYGECWFVDEAGAVIRQKRPEAFSRKLLLRKNCIWQPTVFFRRRVWEATGPLNENLNFAMDYEYWLRVALKARIRSVNRHLACYRWQRDSKTISRERDQLREAYAVVRQFGGGGLVSWYLHHLYWPNTSFAKRWVFQSLSNRIPSGRTSATRAVFPVEGK
jgi:glycosyltransferase involved in cell wall biosynthesis